MRLGRSEFSRDGQGGEAAQQLELLQRSLRGPLRSAIAFASLPAPAISPASTAEIVFGIRVSLLVSSASVEADANMRNRRLLCLSSSKGPKSVSERYFEMIG